MISLDNNPRKQIRSFSDLSLRTKLLIAFLIVALIPLTILEIVDTSAIRQALTDAADERLANLASQNATTIDTFIENNLEIVRTEAQLPVLENFLALPPEERTGNPLEVEIIETLNSFESRDLAFIISYTLLDKDGVTLVDTSGATLGVDQSNRDFFQNPVKTGLAYASPIRLLGDTPGVAGIHFSASIRNRQRETLGVLVLHYNADVFSQILAQSVGGRLEDDGVAAILLDEHHIRLVDTFDSSLVFRSVIPLSPGEEVALQAEGRLPTSSTDDMFTNLPDFEDGLVQAATSDNPITRFSGVAHQGVESERGAIVKLDQQDWFLVFVQGQSRFLEPVQEQFRSALLLALLLIVGVIILAVITAQLLTQPITHLTDVAQQVAGGDLATQVPVESQDETGQLAIAFNTMTNRLRSFVGSLEDQIQERTNELAVSIEVGQRAAAIRDQETLLKEIVEFIRERFGLYYTHVYFVDDIEQDLILQAGTGEVGETLLARRHTLPIGSGSIVGQVATTKQSVVVSDTENSAIHKPNPLLPDTRSELAVPLIVEGQVIGVLDMQADEINTFTEENKTVFEAMATQLAISIDSAQQWALAQESEQRLQEIVSRLTREAWRNKLGTEKNSLNYTYDLATIAPTPEKPTNGGVSAPIVIQNESIGQLSVDLPKEKTLSEDEQNLLSAVAQQLAQKAETIRLFDETRQQATREQIARQIVDKIRASQTIESALQIAAEELGKALNVPRAVVDLDLTQANDLDGRDT
ncbi:MAG: GAF domain-containing protein [Chloroflexota bacterium]